MVVRERAVASDAHEEETAGSNAQVRGVITRHKWWTLDDKLAGYLAYERS